MAQRVKDLVLSLQWLRSLLWHRFQPWPRNFHMPWAWPKRKKKSSVKRREEMFVSMWLLRIDKCRSPHERDD